MHIGMLWFDNDPRTNSADKIRSAAAYYQRKYGRSCNLCFVHPVTFATMNATGDTTTVDAIEVRPNRSVLPNHYWIGVQST